MKSGILHACLFFVGIFMTCAYAQNASNTTSAQSKNQKENLSTLDIARAPMFAMHRRYYRYAEPYSYPYGYYRYPNRYRSRYSRDNEGGIGRGSMESEDRSKLAHALDNPIGKGTTWINENTSITYTVVPIKKVTVNGNPFCREYSVTETRGKSKRESYGTACVDTHSSKWHLVS